MPASNMEECMTEEEFFEWFQNAMQSGMFENMNGGAVPPLGAHMPNLETTVLRVVEAAIIAAVGARERRKERSNGEHC